MCDIRAPLYEVTRWAQWRPRVEVVSRRAEQIGHATQGFVEEHPWVCLGIALGFGLTAGRLVAPR